MTEKASDIDIRRGQESTHFTSLSRALYISQLAAENRLKKYHKAVKILPRPSPITYIQSSKKKKKKRHILEQETLVPMRPTCLRQKNVKKNAYLLLKGA